MNKIYKVIWNAALQCWVAVSELGKAKGKTKSKKVLSAAAVMAVSAVGVSTNVEAAVNYATGTTFGNGMAIGSSSNANTNAAAYGHGANARALEDVAIGYKTISGAPVSGSTSHSSAQASVAVGTYANATHVATTAIGAHANAINNFATAVGAGAQATAENGSAFGQGATATGVYATALGKGALAKQDYSVALGKEAAANTQLTTSIGSKTNATGFSAIAIGSGHVPPGNTVIENIQGAQATADDSMAVGASALANKEGATALGKLSKATNNNAVAVGPDSVASGSWATATGASANASGQASAAFGESARAGGKKSIATGSHASASGENAIASGANAIATKNGATAVGANTEASGDKATALGDLAKAKNNRATALGHDSQATGEFSTAAGVSSRASGIASVATGKNATASGSNAIATGNTANATGTDSIASGRQASATGTGAVATGAEASASGNAAAYGNKAKATGGWSSAFGNEAKATQSDASAFGNSANAGAQNATAVGAHSSVTASGGTALGRGSSVAATDGVALGNGAVANRAARDRNTIVINTADPSKTAGLSDNNNGGDANTVYAPVRLVDAPEALEAIKNTINGNKGAVSVGDSGNTRQIINVAAGSADSDAVNVAQLKAVAGGIKRYSVTSPDGSITVTNPTPGSDPQNFQIKMNTTAVQNAAAWNIKEGSESTSQSVRGGDTVSFSDTDTIDVVRSGKDFKFNAKVSSIKNGENANEGKPWTTDGDGKYLVKTKNVVDAINASGWILQANGNKVGLVNPGDKVNIASGNGITVTPTTEANGVSKITINATVAGIKAGNNVTVSETGGVYTINANDTNTQASVANGTGLTLTESNNSNGTKKYTLGVNVDNNTIKVENGKLVANLSGVTDTNTQSTVEAKANNFVTVDGSTKNTNGTTKYQVGVTTGDVAVTEATGAVTAISAATGVATNKTVADAIAKSGFQLQENGTLRNVVNPGEILNFKPGKGTTVSVGTNGDVQVNANVAGITAGKNISTTTDANGNVTINAKDTSAHVKAANNAAVKVDKADTTRTENNADITDYTVDLTDQTKTNITHGVNANETVTNKGLTFNGNTGSTGIKKLGSEVDVKGNTSNNVITTTANTNGITVDYNGTAAAQVTSLTYKANNANAKSVTLAKGLDFTNGTQTTAEVGDNGVVKFNVNTTTLSNATGNGNIQVPTGANSDGLVTAKNVANAINTSGWNLQANNVSVGLINPSDKVSFDAGNGVTVTSTNEANGVSHIKVAAKVDGSTITVNDQGQLVANLSGAVNTQASVSNATSSPITIATTQNTNGTNNYTVDVNVDGKTITKEGGVLKAVIPSVETVTLTVNTTGNNAGKVEAPTTEADKKKLVTAENVAKAINESYWVAKRGDSVTTNADSGDGDSNVAAGNNVTFVAGKNMALQKAGNKFIYATKDDVTFNNVTANNTTTTNLTVKNGGNVDMGGNKVENVANGTISNNSKDAVNGSQLYAVDNKFNNTVTLGGENNSATEAQKLNKDGGLKFNIVGAENGNITTTASGTDVKIDLTEGTKKDIKQGVDANTTVTNKGLTFNANTGNTGAKKLGSEVDVKGDTANNVITTNATEAGITINYNGTEAAKVTHLTYKANGANEQNVSLATGLNFKNGNGTTVTVGANGEVTYNANVSGLTAGDNVQIKNDGKGNFTIAATDTNTQSSVVNATSSPVTVAVSDNTNGTKQYAVDVNVDGKTITKEGGVLKAVIPSVETVTLTVNTTGNNAGKVEAPTTEADKKKLVTAENVAKAINESYWVAKRGDSVTTNADSGDGDSNVAAGNNVTFVAGKNMALQKAGNKFIYATKDDVTFNNVTANNTTTTNLTVKNGGNVDMGGNQVHNVSTGTAPTDAVNVKQLYDTVSGNVSTESVIKKAGEDNIAEVTVADNKQSGDKNAKYEVSVSKAKIKALANETVKVNTSTAANNPITVTPHTENGNTTYTVNFDGAKAAAEIPLTYKANDGTGKTVKLSEGLNFKNGTQTTAEVGDNGVVKFNVNTTTLSNTTANGKITVPDGNGLVTAKEVANAINAASWNLNVSGATVQNVKAGDFVSFANGNGTTVTYKDGAVRVNANVTDVVSANGNATITRDPNTGIVTVNAKDTNTQASVKNGSGITVTPSTNANGTANYTVAVNVDGSTITVNNDGKLVANVPDTSKVSLTNNAGKVGDVSAEDANKLVTGDNLAKTINATYWKASQGTHEETTSEETTGAVSSEIKPGDELTFVSGKNMALKKDGNKFVYATKDDVTFNNVTTNNLTVNAKGNVDMGGNQVHNVANGTKGTDAVNLDQLNATTAIANAGWVIKANGTNATTVKPNATVSLNNTDGNILITKNTANNNVTFNFNPNATFGVVGKDGKDGVDGSIGVNGKDGASVVINGKDGSIGLTGPKGADGKDGVSLTLKPEKGTTTVNEKDANKEIERIKYTANGTTREVATLDDGLKFAGDDNAVINRTLGSLLNITGGAEKATVADNIRVTNDGKNGLKVQLSNNVTFNANGSVKVGDTTVNNGGLTITGGPSITKDGGVNAGDKVISNVSTGVKDNDAVNVKQLKDTVADSVSTESVIKKADEDNIAEVTVADNKQSGDKNAKYEVSVSKAKIKALANETVKVNTSTAANNPITVTSHTENGNTTYSVNFNGENASKVIPLSYKANDGEAKTVTLSEGLNFKNGTQTTAEVGDNGVVKFNVNTTALSNVTNNGKITVPEGNGLVTAKEVAEAINASYWKANAGGNVDGATVTDNVTTGTEVFFAAGKNLKVKHSANNFTFSTADDVSFNNVTTNNLTVNAKGNVDMGGNQVHNVANGTKGTDAVNLDQLNATTATAKTEVKAGKNVSSVNESKDAKDGHTVYTIDAVDTSAHVKAAESNAAVKVEKAATTRADGNTTVTDYTVDLTDETKANITHGVNANTTVTTKGLTFNGNEGTTGIKKLGSEVDVKGGTANNVITTNATEAGITINYNGTEAAKVTHLTYKANGANAQSVNLTTGLDFTNGTQTTAEVAANGVVKFNVNTTALSNVTNNGKITVPEGNGLVTAKEVAEAINASYWKANAGGNVDGATVTDNVTTGTEVFFAAGKNLKVKHSANNFTFSTADDVSFNNVTTNNLTVNAKGNVDMGGNQVHNVANGTKGTDAVNLDQLNATTATANAGWVIKANGTNATTVKPNATVSLNNTDGNILITKNTANNNVTFNFNPNATFGVVGKDGKDGVDGSIGVKGKDGASVVINGKDGSIGLTGPKGADGKDGVSVTLKPEKGTTTVNAKDDGKEIERIKYTANGTTREVATLDDGLKFKGDSKQVINRTLGSQMNITGGADETTLTDNNIGVVYDKATDGLKVKLAKDVNLTSNGSVTIGNTTLSNNGFTITNKADPSKTVSVTDKGLNNGGNTIINVAPGVNGTDAVNLDQLNATTAIANAGWVIKANGTNATTVKPNATVSLNNTDGNILITKNKTDNNVTFNFNPNATFGVVGKDGKDGVDGSIGVNGKDGSSVVINGKDGSIGLNGKDGKNGLSIKGDQGPAGVDGKDGETKTRIVYEYADPKDPNKTIRENVATLNDGLRFTGNNGVENAHRLNTLVTIVGEGVDKAASANFTSASGNINVKADGKGTLEVQLAKNLKNIETINNGNSTITLNKDGGTTISGGDVSVDGNKVTNVKDGDVSANSKDAVNGSQLYHVMTNATAGWNLSVNNGKDKGNVKPGAQVDLNNTDGNIIISKTANNVTFNFNPNATFGVKGKDGKDGVDGSIGVNGKDGASVVINGKDGSIGLTGPKGADGKDGASANMSVQKGTTTVNTDRDGGKDVTRIVYTDKDKDGKDIKREVATLDDGLKFKGDSEQVINRTLGSQMNITGGADSTKLTDNNIGVVYDEATNGLKVKLSKDVDLGKDGSITIGGTQVTNNGLTIKNGPSVTEKGVDAGNKKVTNVADGDINATSKDAVNGSQLYQAVNNINKNVNAAKTELEEGDNVTITSRVGNNGQTIYKVSSTDNSAHVQGGSDAVSVTKAETTRKDGSTTVTDYTVDLSSKTKDDIKKGVDAHDTVTNKGLTFNADKGTTGAKKLGSQVAVNGDNKNIETVADTNGVKVKLKDDINVNSVTANTFKAGDTIVNTKGVQVAAKDDRGNNTNVVINEKGINAGNTRIQNVAAGRADTDAVNVSQLKGAVTQIGNHINKMDKNLRAGIAGAMAAGGLYHATLPGKSMVAAGAGTYKGESAVAVGYSRLSDNGKVGIKFSVNTNTRGDSGAAASVGYQW
ncbi:ESPR-type extended signal peptide-containing protein [Haemophilus parahaemolyticus]|nr:ESPR-type extended signal peptide-containing protein [Haemophilus parahaemolyticus]